MKAYDFDFLIQFILSCKLIYIYEHTNKNEKNKFDF